MASSRYWTRALRWPGSLSRVLDGNALSRSLAHFLTGASGSAPLTGHSRGERALESAKGHFRHDGQQRDQDGSPEYLNIVLHRETIDDEPAQPTPRRNCPQ